LLHHNNEPVLPRCAKELSHAVPSDKLHPPRDFSQHPNRRCGPPAGFGYGATPTFYTEDLPTRYRASGAIAQVYGGGLIPIIAARLLETYGINQACIYIGVLVMVHAVLAIIAILRTPEIKGKNLEG